MNDYNRRRSDRAVRVQTFGREHAADLTAGSKASALFAEMDTLLADLALARVGQLRGPSGKQAVLDELTADFKAIARTARAIELDDPTFAVAPYIRPTSLTSTVIATHADALLKLLEDNPKPVADGGDSPAQLAAKAALRAKFIAYELPADFVTDLRADRDALTARNADKQADNQEGVENTSAIDTLLAKAQTLVTRLDAAILNKFARDPDKIAAWNSATHDERAPKIAKATESNSTQPGAIH
jgi:hypothetical protein